MNSLEDRVRRLERGALRWRAASVLLLILLIVVVSVGQGKPQREGPFAFRDANGTVRMELRQESFQNGVERFGLLFFDNKGEQVGGLQLFNDRPSLWFKEDEAARRKRALELEAMLKRDERQEREMVAKLGTELGMELVELRERRSSKSVNESRTWARCK